MRFFVTCDANQSAGLDDFLDFLYRKEFDEFFVDRQYDDGGTNLCVVLMCRDPQLRFEQRIRLSKVDNTLYLDILLHLPLIESMSATEKRTFIATKMLEEVPCVLGRYKKRDFDVLRFSRDLREWFELHAVVDVFATDGMNFETN
ncbi:MAG: hypothetical protein AB7J13_10150 [Pyrinomonadaceae bacterium]